MNYQLIAADNNQNIRAKDVLTYLAIEAGVVESLRAFEPSLEGVRLLCQLKGLDVSTNVSEDGSGVIAITTEAGTSLFQVTPLPDEKVIYGVPVVPSILSDYMVFLQANCYTTCESSQLVTIVEVLMRDNEYFPFEASSEKLLRITELAVKAYSAEVATEDAENAVKLFYGNPLAKCFLNTYDALAAYPVVDTSTPVSHVTVSYIGQLLNDEQRKVLMHATEPHYTTEEIVSNLNDVDFAIVKPSPDGKGGLDITLSNPQSSVVLAKINVNRLSTLDENERTICASLASLSDDAVSNRFSL